jgi:hypothetical protein
MRPRDLDLLLGILAALAAAAIVLAYLARSL